MKQERISFATLEKMAKNKEWRNAVIVYKPESFDKEYSLESRSYEISIENRYFEKGKLGTSLFGDCLDGQDSGVRLDWYMKALPSDNIGKRWIVDYCYIVNEEA